MDDPILQAGAIAGALLAVAGLLALAGRAVSWVLRTVRRLGEFLEDWNGEAARPGVAGRLGVMERLDRIEARLPLDHQAASVVVNVGKEQVS